MHKKLLLLGVLMLALCAPAIADEFQHPTRVHLDREGERWAEKTLK